MIKRCNIDFDFKQLIINNVYNTKQVEIYAKKKVDKGIINAYYFADDYIDKALNFFEIEKNSFGKGYYYSSAELVGLYLSKTKYHLHFSSDAIMPKDNSKSNWINSACEILNIAPKFVVANPCWDYNFDDAINQSTESNIGDFIVGYGFSDQCYLVRTADFRAQIYNYKHPDSERYPKYGGELFEKRVDSFMRTNRLLRLTHSKESYIHRNFPKSKLIKRIFLVLIRLNSYFFIRNFKIHLLKLLNIKSKIRIE